MKILIIGAGASGITAGHILEEKGIEFEILEASAVHGGRLKKIEGFADFPIDLGAEWVHKWIKANPPLTESILDETNSEFETFKYRPKTYSLWKFGRLWNVNFIRFFFSALDDHKFVAATWFDFFDQLVTPSLQAHIHYNQPVNKIEYGGEKVVVTTTSERKYEADKLLITVPITILQREFITFDPPLPAEKIAAFNKEEMPDGLKIFIRFSEKFYPDFLFIDSIFYNITHGYGYYDATLGKNSSYHVLGFLGDGDRVKFLAKLENDEEIIQTVLAELDEIFDGKASKYYLNHIVQNWSQAPFIQGTYSHRKGDVATLSAPVGEQLFFAGEAMNSKGNTIAVHGASESAYLALERMLGS